MSTTSGASPITSLTAASISPASKRGEPQWTSESCAMTNESRCIYLHMLLILGTGLWGCPQRVAAAAAPRHQVDHRGRAQDPGTRPRDPGEQPHLVPRPAGARVHRRPPSPEGPLP